MSIHVFRGGVRHDISAPLKRTAVDRRRKSIVHNQRYSIGMGNFRKLFNVQNRQCRIGNGLSEHRFCIRTEGCHQFLFRGIRIHKRHIDSHPLHGDRNQIKRPAINAGGRYNMIPCSADIEQGKEIGCLSAAGQHPCCTAFQFCNLGRHIIIRGVLQSRIKITGRFQIK